MEPSHIWHPGPKLEFHDTRPDGQLERTEMASKGNNLAHQLCPQNMATKKRRTLRHRPRNTDERATRRDWSPHHKNIHTSGHTTDSVRPPWTDKRDTGGTTTHPRTHKPDMGRTNNTPHISKNTTKRKSPKPAWYQTILQNNIINKTHNQRRKTPTLSKSQIDLPCVAETIGL